MTKTVLTVDDSRTMRDMLLMALEDAGYTVIQAVDGVDGLETLDAKGADVIITDINMPKLDGFGFIERVRQNEAHRATPILVLTARDTLEDKLRGYAEGADDYLVKPFALRELEARIRALRRHAHAQTALTFGPLTYDPHSMTASREGRRIPLTRLQGAVLACLLQEAPRIVPHARLLEHGWGQHGGDVAALQTQVYELRALVDKPFAHAMIQSVRGVGYRLLGAA